MFKEAKARGEISRVPLLDTLRFHRREVLLAIGLKVVETAPFYIFSTFIIAFAVNHSGFTRGTGAQCGDYRIDSCDSCHPVGGIDCR